VFIVVSVDFFIDSVRELLDTSPYAAVKRVVSEDSPVSKHHTMKTYRKCVEGLNVFQMSALDGGR